MVRAKAFGEGACRLGRIGQVVGAVGEDQAGQGHFTLSSKSITWSGPMGTIPVGFSALIE